MIDFLWPIFGGVLIGLSATVLLLFNGKIAGISGIIYQAITDKTSVNRKQHWFFLIGILLGAYLFHLLSGKALPETNDNYLLAIIAGLLVGVGVKLGNGCTSGHGVCGIGRLSMRSLAATICFMLTAIISVAIINSIIPTGAL
jgi:uncharacterized membrane protein YedE/YeeE